MSTLTARSRFAIVSLVIAERFSFHSAALVLPMFLTEAPGAGGLGWNVAEALAFVGLYVGAVQFGPLFVGPMAARLFTDRQALVAGILLVASGYFCLALPPLSPAPKDFGPVAMLCLVTLGSALIRPPIAVMGGQIGARSGRHGFGILFVCMNAGSVLGGLIGGAAGELFHWRLSFTIACATMLAALGPALLVPLSRGHDTRTTVPPTGAVPHRPIAIILLVTILFATAFNQANGFVNLFVHTGIDRSIGAFTVPTTWLAATQPLFVLLLAPFLLGVATAPSCAPVLQGFMLRSAAGFGILGTAFLCLLPAVGDRSAVIEIGAILACFLLLAAGELFITPNSMAALTGLTARHRHNAVMGVLFAASGIGGWLSGGLGALGSAIAPWMFFAGIGLSLLLFGGFFFSAAHIGAPRPAGP